MKLIHALGVTFYNFSLKISMFQELNLRPCQLLLIGFRGIAIKLNRHQARQDYDNIFLSVNLYFSKVFPRVKVSNSHTSNGI